MIRNKPLSFIKQKKIALIFCVVLVAILCIFLRLYRIDHTIEFWGDIGRDHEKLMEWYQTGKPPLNGPNTILKIVNQSPWFFYVNYPVFLLLKSPLTMTITVTSLMIGAFFAGLFILKKQKKEQFVFLILFLLTSIHPLIVQQQRTPWNPSFSIPFLILGIACYLRLYKLFSKSILGVALIAYCMALGMTYSLFPVIALLSILLFLKTPKEMKSVFIIYLIISFFIIFLPNIVFEIKSNFFLLRRFPGGINIPPVSGTFFSKIVFAFSTVIFGGEKTPIFFWEIVALPLIVLIHLYKSYLSKNNHDSAYIYYFKIAIIGTFITLLMPFQQGYYLLGVMILWFLVVAHMKKPYLFTALILCIIFWYKPIWKGEALRPIAQLDQCAKEFCSKYPGKYYVSANAWHGMHSAHDQAFFINKNGCTARDIISHPEWKTDKMIVVADRSLFTPYQSSYYELEQFGSYDVKQYLFCSQDLQYWLLQKK